MAEESSPDELKRLANRVAEMPREEVLGELRRLRCSFPLDFTDDYLRRLNVDQLRHILMAALLHRVR